MDLNLRSQQSDLQKRLTEARHKVDILKTKSETEAKYLNTLKSIFPSVTISGKSFFNCAILSFMMSLLIDNSLFAVICSILKVF